MDEHYQINNIHYYINKTHLILKHIEFLS